MRGYNKVVMMGNLVREPERPSDNAPVKFTLAINKKYRGRNGDTVEHVDFIPCNAWGKLGDEVVLRYCHKGSPLFVEGEISTRDFDDPKTGQHRWSWEVNVSNVVLLGSSGGAASRSGAQESSDAAVESETQRLEKLVYGARGNKQEHAGESMSLRDEAMFPDDELGFDPHSAEGQDLDIPF